MFFFTRRKLTPEERQSHIADRRVHLANERTLLAWIRTSVSIMGFGFMVAKFNLFYQSYLAEHHHANLGRDFTEISEWIGVTIVVLGCFAGVMAIVRFVRIEKDIEHGRFRPSIIPDMLLNAVFIVLAMFLAIYLLNSSSFTSLF